MKYRWITQVVTRHSGMLNIYCNSREQAEGNVDRFSNAYNSSIKGSTTIGFSSMDGSPNCIILDEIIAVTVGDNELTLNLHREEALLAQRLHQEIDFSQNSDEDD